jgi:purine-binding chemotaxis protein CheW
MLGLLQCENFILGVPSDDVAEVCVIERLNQLATSAPGVIGAITVRDVLIPVCDPLVLCNLASRASQPKAAAIVWNNDRMIALAVDGILGIRRCKLSDLQKLGAEYENSALSGHIVTERDIINIVNVSLILDMPGMPSAPRQLRRKRRGGSRRTLPYLTFAVGDVTYAVAASHIQGSVPRRDIEDTQLANGILLGFLSNLGHRIPVVETNAVFGLGNARREEKPEFVILQFGDNRLLGLAVDRIRRIEYLSPQDIRSMQKGLTSAVPSVNSIFTLPEDGSEAFVLDLDRLREMPALKELSALSGEKEGSEPSLHISLQQDSNGDIHKERRRYLVFQAGRVLAAPISDIERVMDLPEFLTPMAGGVLGVQGLFFVEGRPVPLVDLSVRVGGQASTPPKTARVLLVEHDGERVGFRVNKIDGIALSHWRTRPSAALPGGFDNAMITLNHEKVLVDCVQFETLLHRTQEDMFAAKSDLLQDA